MAASADIEKGCWSLEHFSIRRGWKRRPRLRVLTTIRLYRRRRTRSVRTRTRVKRQPRTGIPPRSELKAARAEAAQDKKRITQLQQQVTESATNASKFQDQLNRKDVGEVTHAPRRGS